MLNHKSCIYTTHGVACIVLRVLPRRRWSSLPCVVCHFSSTAFLYDMILMVEEFLYSPRLPGSPTWIAPDTQVHKVSSSDEECGIFSGLDVIDWTTPAATKEETDYFQPAKGKPKREMPYSLQQYNLCPAVVTLCSSCDDRTAGELPLPNDPSSLGPSASKTKSKGKSKHSAVNKIYNLAQKLDALKYAGRHSAWKFGIPWTAIRGWKGLDQQPRNKKISQARKGKKKAGAGCPLSYNEYSDKQLCQWVLECLICICQSKEGTCREMQSPQSAQHFLLSKHLLGGWPNFWRDIPWRCTVKLPPSRSCQLNDPKAIRGQHKFPLELIINMDETPVCFDMALNTTVDWREKEVIIRGTGAHKCHFTVTLTCIGSGWCSSLLWHLRENLSISWRRSRSRKTMLSSQHRPMDGWITNSWCAGSARCSWKTQKGIICYWFLISSRSIWRRKSLPSWLKTIFPMW